MKAEALALGFKHVESGPLVRSSYHARDQVPGAELRTLRRRATIDAEGRVVPRLGPPRTLENAPRHGDGRVLRGCARRAVRGTGNLRLAADQLHERLDERADRDLGERRRGRERDVAGIAHEDRDVRLVRALGRVDVDLGGPAGRLVEPHVRAERARTGGAGDLAQLVGAAAASRCRSRRASRVDGERSRCSESTPLRCSGPTYVTITPASSSCCLSCARIEVLELVDGAADPLGIAPRPAEQPRELLGRAELEPAGQVAGWHAGRTGP